MNVKKQNILADLQVSRLPSLPHVLIEMLDACRSSQTSFQEMATIISRDAAVSARVVSLANSPFYNRGTHIDSLERALFILGTETIKTIVITASIQQFFSGFNQDQASHLKFFWRHSLATALISKSLAILTSYPKPDEAYLTGLLHNVGELVLETNFPKQFSEVNQEKGLLSRAKKEKALFNIDHTKVGAHLVKEWGLGDLAADAIEFHHASKSAIRDAHHLVKLIYLSGLLAEEEALEKPQVFDVAETLFELNASLVKEIVNKIDSEVKEVSASLGIEIDSNAAKERDHEKQVELAKKVRNISLIQTATSQFEHAETRQDLEQAFESSLKLIFNFNQCAIFWFNADEGQLTYTPNQIDSPPFNLKLGESASLISTAAKANKILTTFDEQIQDRTIVDQQISRLLKAKGFVCLPVNYDNALTCVLVAGLNNPSLIQTNQKTLLQYFAEEIALISKSALEQQNAPDAGGSSQDLSALALEIAHEANNPLNIISNYLAALGNKLKNNEEVQEELSILKEEVERTGSILLRLKDLQSNPNFQNGETNINHEISQLIKLYKQSLFLAHSINCDLQLDPSLKLHSINRNSLRQILTNLLKNAVEAQSTGGAVSVSTSACVNVNGSDFVEICVRDEGAGIQDSILKNLFNPTTSTKGKGHSGLGLSITKNLVTDANGSISCRSSKQGTEFQILLPIKET